MLDILNFNSLLIFFIIAQTFFVLFAIFRITKEISNKNYKKAQERVNTIDLEDQIKKELHNEFGYDYASESWTNDMNTTLSEIIAVTEHIVKKNYHNEL
jgi:hypothetical protein